MEGTLFRYGADSQQLAFQSAAPGLPNCQSQQVLLIGGLSDGLGSLPYAGALAAALQAVGWGLTQAQLTSSYHGYGVSSLNQDADELLALSRYLRSHLGTTRIALMGHSTGCQDTVRFMQRHGAAPEGAAQVAATILQAPVSDQEWLSGFPELKDVCAKAEAMAAEGRREEIVCRFDILDGAPMTARRFLSLYCPRGDDDMFSSYLSDDELSQLLRPLAAAPCLVLASGADEAVPQGVDGPGQGERLVRAIGRESNSATLRVLDGACHNLKGHETEAAEALAAFLANL